MRVIEAQNINQLWPKLLEAVATDTQLSETRNGAASVFPFPVGVAYSCPTERVLLDPVRDANPFFTLFESLWMLAGRDDATWLDQFVHDYSARYAEADGHQHGAYGYRWRNHFPTNDANPEDLDQIELCIKLLKEDPNTRQAVLQMWDPSVDLGANVKDKPCNQQVLLRTDRGVLDILVTSRSGDIVWGLTTANCVHFSVLGEYIAARIGIEFGCYTHVTSNLHLYKATLSKVDLESARKNSEDPYPGTRALVDHCESFDEELDRFLADPENSEPYRNKFFQHTARPLWLSNTLRREKRWQLALVRASEAEAPDWRAAAVGWLQRRVDKIQAKED